MFNYDDRLYAQIRNYYYILAGPVLCLKTNFNKNGSKKLNFWLYF